MTNIISRNGCRVTQIKTQNEKISYNSELEKQATNDQSYVSVKP